jgi:RNA polymerase sigma-70 factor (ECF subfamily)
MAKPDRPQAAESEVPTRPVPDADARERLFRLAYRFTWSHADAEDAVQGAMTAAWQHARNLRDETKWWTWLCSIVVQRCRELRRKSSTWQRHAEPYGRHASAPGASSGEAAAMSDRVRELLPRLAPRQYEVIVLRHLQGMDFEEIAGVLGISASTARVHAQAGREALRGLLFAESAD